MPMAQVKSIVFRYIMTYYNRIRIYTGNPGGLPLAMYRQAERGPGCLIIKFWVFILCTVLHFSKL